MRLTAIVRDTQLTAIIRDTRLTAIIRDTRLTAIIRDTQLTAIIRDTRLTGVAKVRAGHAGASALLTTSLASSWLARRESHPFRRR